MKVRLAKAAEDNRKVSADVVRLERPGFWRRINVK